MHTGVSQTEWKEFFQWVIDPLYLPTAADCCMLVGRRLLAGESSEPPGAR
jgi:hypothetical protein